MEPGSYIGKYKLNKRLGHGSFAKVWKASTENDSYVAIKVFKIGRIYRDSADTENTILSVVEKNKSKKYSERIIKKIENFQHRVKKGLHECIVFELMGATLNDVLSKYFETGIEELDAKKIIKNIIEGLHFLHTNCGYAHLDIKPENILLKTGLDPENPSTWKIVISDVGSAERPKDSKNSRFRVQTEYYRAPEVFLRHGYGFKADIWSVGCVLYELLTGCMLLKIEPGKEVTIRYLKQMVTLFGDLPPTFVRKYSHTSKKYFNDDMSLKLEKKVRKKSDLSKLLPETSPECIYFLKNLLSYTPTKRPSTKGLLSKSWLTLK